MLIICKQQQHENKHDKQTQAKQQTRWQQAKIWAFMALFRGINMQTWDKIQNQINRLWSANWSMFRWLMILQTNCCCSWDLWFVIQKGRLFDSAKSNRWYTLARDNVHLFPCRKSSLLFFYTSIENQILYITIHSSRHFAAIHNWAITIAMPIEHFITSLCCIDIFVCKCKLQSFILRTSFKTAT